MNIGGIGSFAGGLAGGYTGGEELARKRELTDAQVGEMGERGQLLRAEAGKIGAEQVAMKKIGARLRAQGFHALASSFDSGPPTATGYSEWQQLQQQQPDNMPSPTLTQPGGQPIYGSPFGA